MDNNVKQKNKLAIAGLICSLCGFFTCGILSIFGIVLSILGLKKSKELNGEGRKSAVFGIVAGVILIISYVIIIVLLSTGIASLKVNKVPILNRIIGERLTCTYSTKETGMKANQTVYATFKKDKLSRININLSVKVDDKYKDYINTFERTFEEQFKKYKNNGAKLDINTKNNNINVDILINLSELSDKQKKYLGIIEQDKSTLKGNLIKQGYTCR